MSATTSPPLTRRAASAAQSIRLLLRSDLVCVLWFVRGLVAAPALLLVISLLTTALQVARVARRRLANRALLGECRLGRAIGLFGSRCCLRLAVALRPTC